MSGDECRIGGCELTVTSAGTLCRPHRYAIYDRRTDAPMRWSQLVADVDEMAVELAVKGERVELTTFERREAVRIMTARGLSARVISQRVRVSKRQVVRDRGRVAA